MTNLKKKAWIAFGGLSLLAGLVITILVLTGSEVFLAFTSAATVLASCLFFIIALYSPHLVLRWITWAATAIMMITQVSLIWINDWSSENEFINFAYETLPIMWLTAFVLTAMSVFSMSYRFVKDIKLAKIGYWTAIAFASLGIVFVNIARFTGDYYLDESIFSKFTFASFTMGIFIALVVAVFAIMERQKEKGVERESLNKVASLVDTPVAPVATSGVSMITPEFEEAFIHFVKLYEEGKLKVDYATSGNHIDEAWIILNEEATVEDFDDSADDIFDLDDLVEDTVAENVVIDSHSDMEEIASAVGGEVVDLNAGDAVLDDPTQIEETQETSTEILPYVGDEESKPRFI